MPATLGGAGLVVLILAQRLLEPPRVSLAAACLLVLGLVLWTLAQTLTHQKLGYEPLTPAAEVRGPSRRLLLAVAFSLAVIAWLGSSAGVYTLANVVAWIGAAAAWCWAWWPQTPGQRDLSSRVLASVQLRRLSWLLVLAAIVVVGAFFRFSQLADVPSDPTSDHAEKLLDIHDLDTGERPVFFPRNTGREPAQFYLTYGLMKVLGLSLSFETLKLGTALIGLLAIPAVFLFASEVGGRAAGLFAAGLFAVSTWPVETARAGLRFPYAPLATALALWLLLRYIRRGDRRDALACGVVIGVGLHGYTPFRIVPLLVPILLGLALLYRRRSPGETAPLVAGGGLIFTTAFLASLPLARYAFDHPDLVAYRARTRAVGDLGWTETLSVFLENTWNALLAFNWRGDPGQINAVQLEPFLDPTTGAALLAGMSILVWQLVARRSFTAAAVLVSAPILLVPSTLSVAFPEENPAVNRLGTAAPLVFTVAALPFAFLWESLGIPQAGSWMSAVRLRPLVWIATIVLVATTFGICVAQNYRTYFRDYARQHRAFVPSTQEVAAAMRRKLGEGFALNRMYVLGYPNWVDGRNVGFALSAPDWYLTNNIEPEEPLPHDLGGRPLLFVLHPADTRRRSELEAHFPSGVYGVVPSEVPRHDFGLYSITPP